MQELMTTDKMTSMQIAEVTGKEHKNIIRDIRDEEQKLKNGGFNTELKFEPREREGITGKIPYYELTKEGVLQLAARYDAVVRAKLIELVMQQQAPKPTCLEDVLISQLQEMKAMRQQLAEVTTTATEVKQELSDIRNVITLDTRSWRQDTTKIINAIARKLGGNEHIRDVRTEAYQLLDKRFTVSLETRLTNKRNRMAGEGICKSNRDKLNQLDVIADDKKLIEGFVAIVKEMAVKYGIEQRREEIERI